MPEYIEGMDKKAVEVEVEIQRLIAHVETVFQGKHEVVELSVVALLAQGHILFEDVPGVGKTTLAHALARSIGADFRRVQFTSDLLPADIVGVSIFSRREERFEFKPGPLFTHVVLGDEINRTTPRTQSALLEAMGEGRVSVDHETHDLPSPFLVLATQNPMDFHGTYPLPESQLDRFLMRLSIGYPSPSVEKALLLKRSRAEPVDTMKPILTLDGLRRIQEAVSHVTLDDSLADYLLAVVQATRNSPHLRTGVSTRGALALAHAARAHALVKGRRYCVPDDLIRLFGPVLAHRISLAGSGSGLGSNREDAEALISELVLSIAVPE